MTELTLYLSLKKRGSYPPFLFVSRRSALSAGETGSVDEFDS